MPPSPFETVTEIDLLDCSTWSRPSTDETSIPTDNSCEHAVPLYLASWPAFLFRSGIQCNLAVRLDLPEVPGPFGSGGSAVLTQTGVNARGAASQNSGGYKFPVPERAGRLSLCTIDSSKSSVPDAHV